MEKVTFKITRPDFTTYENTFTHVKTSKDENGITVYSRECPRLLVAFYPMDWAIELVKVESL
jgi:hypothetical protein